MEVSNSEIIFHGNSTKNCCIASIFQLNVLGLKNGKRGLNWKNRYKNKVSNRTGKINPDEIDASVASKLGDP